MHEHISGFLSQPAEIQCSSNLFYLGDRDELELSFLLRPDFDFKKKLLARDQPVLCL